MSTFEAIVPLWKHLQGSFLKMVKELPEQDLTLQAGAMSIGKMIRHNAEAEFMMTEWYFNKPMPDGLEIYTRRGAAGSTKEFTNLQELVDILEASSEHLIAAMRELPEERWHDVVESPIGPSTRLEAVSRMMYHTGLHAGQISLVRKNAAAAANQ